MSDIFGYEGFKDLSNIVQDYIKKIDNVEEILEVGAKEFVSDLLKLSKPISSIRKSGYTHLIKTFSYKKKKKEVEIGWGKYYGPMLENGTIKMNAVPHIKPVWNSNKEKYYKSMFKKLEII